MYQKVVILAFVLAQLAIALPTGVNVERNIYAKRLEQQTTVNTLDTLTTAFGPMVQTCVVVLTPIVGPNGEELVEEVRSCTLSPLDPAAQPEAPVETPEDVPEPPVETPDAPAETPSDIPAESAPVESAPIESAPVESAPIESAPVESAPVEAPTESAIVEQPVESAPVESASVVESTPPVNTDLSTSTAVAGDLISVNPGFATVSVGDTAPTGTESAPVDNSASSDFAAPTSVSDSAAPSDAIPSDAIPSGSNAISPSAAAVSETAAPAAETSGGPDDRGRSINVLPIGLGVFAGISAIALIVVGLVTYERTKYRKAFRERKLAEAGSGMAYGGMAQRV